MFYQSPTVKVDGTTSQRLDLDHIKCTGWAYHFGIITEPSGSIRLAYGCRYNQHAENRWKDVGLHWSGSTLYPCWREH